MKLFGKVSDPEICDAAFFSGLLTPSARRGLIPLPVQVDGLPTIAFCIKAAPLVRPDVKILHPIAVIPHRKMLMQNLRAGDMHVISRTAVMPIDVRHAKLHRAAMEDPDAFFGDNWNT